MSRGWGCLEPPGQALPYFRGTGRAETQSARPHPSGFLSHLGGAGTTSEQWKGQGRLAQPTPPPSLTEEGQAGRGGGGSAWRRETGSKELGQEGGQLGAKGREEVWSGL